MSGASGELIVLDDSEKGQFPVKTTTHELDIDTTPGVSIVISRFADKKQILITNTGKASTIYEVKRDRVSGSSNENPVEVSQEKHIYTVSTLVGLDSTEYSIVARLLGQVLSSDKPLLVCLGFEDAVKSLQSPKAVRQLVDFVKSVM